MIFSTARVSVPWRNWSVKLPLRLRDYLKVEYAHGQKSFGIMVAEDPRRPVVWQRCCRNGTATHRRDSGTYRVRWSHFKNARFSNVRLRVHGAHRKGGSWTENHFPRRRTVQRRFPTAPKELGFTYITLDLEGFSSMDLLSFNHCSQFPASYSNVGWNGRLRMDGSASDYSSPHQMQTSQSMENHPAEVLILRIDSRVDRGDERVLMSD